MAPLTVTFSIIVSRLFREHLVVLQSRNVKAKDAVALLWKTEIVLALELVRR